MADFVSNRRASILACAATMAILWALFVVPGGNPWTGFVWLGALAFLLVSSVMLQGLSSPPSPVPVIQAIDGPTKGRKS
jgi:hypothetical protein